MTVRHVRASGDWVFAPLASFGLCDHSFSPTDKAAENEVSRRSPSRDDLQREQYIRNTAADMLAQGGLPRTDTERIRRSATYAGTDVTAGCVPGGHGGTEELRATAEILQTSVVILDADAIDDRHAPRERLQRRRTRTLHIVLKL